MWHSVVSPPISIFITPGDSWTDGIRERNRRTQSVDRGRPRGKEGIPGLQVPYAGTSGADGDGNPIFFWYQMRLRRYVPRNWDVGVMYHVGGPSDEIGGEICTDVVYIEL